MNQSGVRFAPSPTGRLHIGNLRTAWISERLARALAMPWVVRFEDIDRPRLKPGAREQQLADLLAIGLVPDKIYDQSERLERHWTLFLRAVEDGKLYPCTCSRGDVAEHLASAPHDGVAPTYSGKCRHQSVIANGAGKLGWRFKMPNLTGQDDFVVARVSKQDLRNREKFTPSYHWACAIDDMDGRYKVLVRASDLAPALRLQREIQKTLMPEFIPPAVFHTALVVHDDGHRLEKRSLGVTLDDFSVPELLRSFDKSISNFSSIASALKLSAVVSEKNVLLSLSELMA